MVTLTNGHDTIRVADGVPYGHLSVLGWVPTNQVDNTPVDTTTAVKRRKPRSNAAPQPGTD